MEELEKYRNKVNGDALEDYFGYFALSKILNSTINQAFAVGLIYKLFKDEDIRQLQDFLTEFTINGENYINGQINNKKELFRNLNLRPGVKRMIIGDIDFWENKFNIYKNFLTNLEYQ